MSAMLAGLSGVAATPGKFARFAYVGCRTTKDRGTRGRGITVYRIDAAFGAWTQAQRVDDLVNLSYLS